MGLTQSTVTGGLHALDVVIHNTLVRQQWSPSIRMRLVNVGRLLNFLFGHCAVKRSLPGEAQPRNEVVAAAAIQTIIATGG